ncbi:MAG: GNAT family N-acetyltransferase [Pirellulales bacterium]|nr:GNAT family N-acetyltransferase [Pirellulales bacterium]
MIQYRPFRNTDTPAIVDIWRARAVERGRAQAITPQIFDQFVLSKPYFDREGLIVAIDGTEPVGYVHAGFGPNENETGLSIREGVTCMLMVRHDHRRLGIGSELLARSEAYLQARGAKVLFGGGVRPLIPFYLGLYGGSDLPGVIDSDADAQRLYRAAGYIEVGRTLILQRELPGFRPPVDRQQIQIRRQTNLQTIEDPPTRSWWDACTFGSFDRMRFELHGLTGGAPLAACTVWAIEPLGSSWGVHAAGLIDLTTDPAQRHQGYATALVSETLKHLQQLRFGLVEVQISEGNLGAQKLFTKLGFAEIERGRVFRKG